MQEERTTLIFKRGFLSYEQEVRCTLIDLVEFAKWSSITNARRKNHIDLQKGVPILRIRTKMDFDLVDFSKGVLTFYMQEEMCTIIGFN